MKLADLQKRIASGENLHTDFKERFDFNRELAKDLVCFANTDGGQLIFGVSSDKRIVGVDDPDWLFNKVKNPAPKDLALVCPGRGLSMTLLNILHHSFKLIQAEPIISDLAQRTRFSDLNKS